MGSCSRCCPRIKPAASALWTPNAKKDTNDEVVHIARSSIVLVNTFIQYCGEIFSVAAVVNPTKQQARYFADPSDTPWPRKDPGPR
jgi:hypothetical protein